MLAGHPWETIGHTVPLATQLWSGLSLSGR